MTIVLCAECLCPVACTTSDLVEVRVGFRFAHPIKIFHINQLEIKSQTGVGDLELGQFLDMRQVAQVFISPVVEVTQTVRQEDRNTLSDDMLVLYNNKQVFNQGALQKTNTMNCIFRLTNLARARPCASRSMVGTPSRTNRVKRDCSILEYFWKAIFLITGGNW